MATLDTSHKLVFAAEPWRALEHWATVHLRPLRFEWADYSLWNMSSTLKKRRAKMNKHKLRKRRKKLRRKTK